MDLFFGSAQGSRKLQPIRSVSLMDSRALIKDGHGIVHTRCIGVLVSFEFSLPAMLSIASAGCML